jgi:hypothetical protein
VPTRAQAETAIIAKNSGVLALAGVDVTTTTPPRAIMDGPIGESLTFCGVVVDDVTAPDDDDMARLAAADWYKFVDVAALLLLEDLNSTVSGMAGTSQRWVNYSVSTDIKGVQSVLAARRMYVQNRWGFGLAKLVGGSFRVRQKNPSAEM